jgi:hypothetical protein
LPHQARIGRYCCMYIFPEDTRAPSSKKSSPVMYVSQNEGCDQDWMALLPLLSGYRFYTSRTCSQYTLLPPMMNVCRRWSSQTALNFPDLTRTALGSQSTVPGARRNKSRHLLLLAAICGTINITLSAKGSSVRGMCCSQAAVLKPAHKIVDDAKTRQHWNLRVRTSAAMCSCAGSRPEPRCHMMLLTTIMNHRSGALPLPCSIYCTAEVTNLWNERWLLAR